MILFNIRQFWVKPCLERRPKSSLMSQHKTKVKLWFVHYKSCKVITAPQPFFLLLVFSVSTTVSSEQSPASSISALLNNTCCLLRHNLQHLLKCFLISHMYSERIFPSLSHVLTGGFSSLHLGHSARTVLGEQSSETERILGFTASPEKGKPKVRFRDFYLDSKQARTPSSRLPVITKHPELFQSKF